MRQDGGHGLVEQKMHRDRQEPQLVAHVFEIDDVVPRKGENDLFGADVARPLDSGFHGGGQRSRRLRSAVLRRGGRQDGPLDLIDPEHGEEIAFPEQRELLGLADDDDPGRADQAALDGSAQVPLRDPAPPGEAKASDHGKADHRAARHLAAELQHKENDRQDKDGQGPVGEHLLVIAPFAEQLLNTVQVGMVSADQVDQRGDDADRHMDLDVPDRVGLGQMVNGAAKQARQHDDDDVRAGVKQLDDSIPNPDAGAAGERARLPLPFRKHLGAGTAFKRHLFLHSSYCFRGKNDDVLAPAARPMASTHNTDDPASASAHTPSSDVPDGIDTFYNVDSIC